MEKYITYLKGDSGGPLVLSRGDDAQKLLIGVVSYGFGKYFVYNFTIKAVIINVTIYTLKVAHKDLRPVSIPGLANIPNGSWKIAEMQITVLHKCRNGQ